MTVALYDLCVCNVACDFPLRESGVGAGGNDSANTSDEGKEGGYMNKKMG